MAAVLLGNVVRHLRAVGHAAAPDEMTDAHLLERFVHQNDEAAFAALLRRHGPMVLSVCRQVLGQSQDAEDAFQAAFLVLVRRAASIRKHKALASWLYGVALRTARQALLGQSRRRRRERRAAVAPVETATDDLTWREVQAILHEEIERLPETYRAPLVLCYLEGQSNARAARQLGVPAGSLSKRLGRARGLLRGRLLRRGVALPAGALLALPVGQAAAVPPALARETACAAAEALHGTPVPGAATALADGVSHTLFAAKLKAACVWLLALGAVAAGSWLASGRGVAEPRAAAKQRSEPARRRAAPPAPDEKRPAPPPAPDEKLRDLEPPPPAEPPPADEPAPRDRQGPAEVKRRLLLRHGGTEQTEAAVAAGLEWLAQQQKQDGHWALDGTGQINDTAGTAFGLLPLLAAGHAHTGPLGKGPYAARIQKGLDYLVHKQSTVGDLGGTMYGHALGTMALCRAYALTADAKLKLPAQRAVDFIVRAQHDGGGWRYGPNQPGDTSVTAWQAAALHAARQSGLAVPARTLDQAHLFLDSCQSAEGSYSYTPGGGDTPTVTAASLMSRLNLGWGTHVPAFRTGFERLAKLPPAPVTGMYHDYWATQVFFRRGGDEWAKHNAQVQKRLVDRQEKGSWAPADDTFGKQGGRLMVTSLALLTLEVYYRDELPLALAPRAVGKDELGQSWDHLEAADELTARRAVWALVGAPEKALPLLKEQLPPRPPPGLDGAVVARLIADLDSDSFEKREQASADLEKIGRPAEILLREARAKTRSAEVRRRLDLLTAKFEDAHLVPPSVRWARAVEVLEHIGTPEAVRFLGELAEKEPDGDLGREARAALRRLRGQ
jgi:RNA polymerase sigma factor (sigma-70 family)